MGDAMDYISEGGLEMTQLFSEWLRSVYMGDFLKILKGMDPSRNKGVEYIAKESKEFQRNFLGLAIKKLRGSLMFSLGQIQLASVAPSEHDFHTGFSKLVNADKVENMVIELEKAQRYLGGNSQAQMTLMALSLRLHSIIRSA
jgi:hypothetical protein